MATDPIRAALEAAVDAYDAARVSSFGGDVTRDGMSPANKAHLRPMIAAALAAFLRDFSAEADLTRWDRAEGKLRRLYCAELHHLAAAVEEAARDG